MCNTAAEKLHSVFGPIKGTAGTVDDRGRWVGAARDQKALRASAGRRNKHLFRPKYRWT
jgi:hypothetical protein